MPFMPTIGRPVAAAPGDLEVTRGGYIFWAGCEKLIQESISKMLQALYFSLKNRKLLTVNDYAGQLLFSESPRQESNCCLTASAASGA
jgi:hypothetical protein